MTVFPSDQGRFPGKPIVGLVLMYDQSSKEKGRSSAALWWSCRESNPGPTACPQGFSVRSPLRLSRISRSHGLAGMTIPVAVRCSGESRDRTHRWIPLADVRVRAEGVPGLTDLLSLR